MDREGFLRPLGYSRVVSVSFNYSFKYVVPNDVVNSYGKDKKVLF